MGAKRATIEELEKETQSPDFWQDARAAARKSKELADLKEELDRFAQYEKEVEELSELAKLVEGDERPQGEVASKLEILENDLRQEELRVFLSGKYDGGNATLSVYAGAGGQDAQDWAAMLLRMYERYCSIKGFRTKILHRTFGEPSPEGEIGIKSVMLEVEGRYAYGFLKGERGVHRLVRISPFSAQKLRHTSFAMVEVLPQFSKDWEREIEIRPEDLRVDTFRASGPGGQYVNRRESAVRVTHLPTGMTVSCQLERLQGQNRAKAMELLYAKLFQLKSEQQAKEISGVKGKRVSAGWGNQIRSYVLHPYKMVKDLRTNVETSDAEGVLDGNLEQFIEAEIK